MIINQRELLKCITRSMVVQGKKFVNPEFIEAKDSLIVFTDDKALKIIKKEKGKDYSDPQSRYAWLHEEMRINTEITPNFYFGVRLSGKLNQDDQILMQEFCSLDSLNKVIEEKT